MKKSLCMFGMCWGGGSELQEKKASSHAFNALHPLVLVFSASEVKALTVSE